MPLAVLQQKLNSFPEAYFDEINAFFDLLSYKVAAQATVSAQKQKVTPGLAEGNWKYPNDIHAFDDEVADMFEGYL